MRDEYDARFWNEHHGDFAQAIDDGRAAVRHAFTRLTARLYDAPWQRSPNARRDAC